MGKVTRVTVFSVCLAILMNCSPTTSSYQDPRVEPYIREFIRIGKLFNVPDIEVKTRQIKVSIGKTDDKNYAVCYPYLNELVLNEDTWDKLPVENKEELFFHEAGHCVLGQIAHTESGIMRPAGMYFPTFYRYFRSELINDLFGCKTYDCVDIPWKDSTYYGLKKEKPVTKEEIMNNEHAVVRFTATWCPPCKALGPVFDEVAAAHPDVKVYVVDVDQNKDLARDMGIRGLPTMVQIKNNKVENTMVGNQPKPEIEKLFTK